MKAISYEAKDSLPGIILEKESGKFKIYGKSFPEDAFEFYDPIFNWFDGYIENPLQNTVFDFQMSYFNTVSAKVFLNIMTKMETLAHSGFNATIRWFYNEEDEDSKEAGEDFESILDVKFELISINDGTSEKEDNYFDDLMNDIT